MRRSTLPVILLLAALVAPLTIAAAQAPPSGAHDIASRLGSLDGQLHAQIQVVDGTGQAPGSPVAVTVAMSQLSGDRGQVRTPVPASFEVVVRRPDGTVSGPFGRFTAGRDGIANVVLPGEATEGITFEERAGYRSVLAVEVVNATYDGVVTDSAGETGVNVAGDPEGLTLRNEFISSLGWVKAGESYPFRVSVVNHGADTFAGTTVTLPPVDGTTFTKATALNGGTATISGGTVTWDVGSVAPGSADEPVNLQMIVEARADSAAQDPQIVWKDLSSTATLTHTGQTEPVVVDAQGPHVIPDNANFDSARYGLRPFPVVPVDWVDRKHNAANTGDRIDAIINDREVPGSTVNLFEEMSYGQLTPLGTVPSSDIETAGWDVDWTSERYQNDGWGFTQLDPQGTCNGATFGDSPELLGTPFHANRITNGWYQMPGTTEYYGTDKYSAGAIAGAVGGVSLIFSIDDACGKTGKAVFDAAHIADPEIDYNEYDTDKDGVVDFFMMLYVGCGGHFQSQRPVASCPAEYSTNGVPAYDNIWPHSSSLEHYYSDPQTGQKGYVSDDRLIDLEGNPMFYTDGSYSQLTVTETDFPAYVRVGPYNVNPETSVDKASVISHEYGHSLGLPDYYSLGSRDTYGDWSLMATDKQHYMDIHGRQDMGWVIPEPVTSGTVTMQDGKVDTHRIVWQTANGTPYTLEGPKVHNGQAYKASLPGRILIDAAKVAENASPDHVYFSGSGNDFGCTPTGGHNLDVFLPELEDIAPGTPITMTFKSYWDIEWDWDYGFVMVTDDDGTSYRSLPSENGYTTDGTYNPNGNGCQGEFGNGITGASASYAAGTEELDRRLDDRPDGGFIEDQYDLSDLAGGPAAVRFSYATDPAVAGAGWFIDDIEITAGDEVIYSSDFEVDREPGRLFPGGCNENTRVASTCTVGWNRISSLEGTTADHAYYMELRDRSSFDIDGKDQNDRTPIAFQPGFYLMYTNEAHAYGNTGADGAPGQSPLDSVPDPGNTTPDLNDAAFIPTDGRNAFSDFIDDDPWIDNYEDPKSEDELWRFEYNCLSFDVLSMSGHEEPYGPLAPPYDLTAEVEFAIGEGCVPFLYGAGGAAAVDGLPTAVIDAKTKLAKPGQDITFDGSGSSDDTTAPEAMTYAWDFGDGTTADGRTVSHAYAAEGTYTVTLTVTDEGGNQGTDSIDVTVSAAASEPLPTTGGGAALAGLLLVGAGLAGRLRRR